MARRSPPAEPPREPELRVSPEAAAEKLHARIAIGQTLLKQEVQNLPGIEELRKEHEKWHSYNMDLLIRLFTTDKLKKEYSYSGAQPVMLFGPPSHAQRLATVKENISGHIHGLESIIDRLELFPVTADAAQATSPAVQGQPAKGHTNKAFIVHGHDGAARESVARFLSRLGVEPIILHEQATEGRTLIEKLEHYSDVDFAVVLLTPDDVGAANADAGNLQPRARQNVVLELGYFAGKLTRRNVCALYQGPLELPSDLVGVGYVELDAGGGWQIKLARELKAAGFTIDSTALLG